MKRYFACFSAADVERHWMRLAWLFAPAVDRCDGEWSLNHVYQQAMAGELFIAAMCKGAEIELALAMTLGHYPQKTVLSISLIGGRHLLLFAKEYGHHILDFARDCGCSDVEFHSRAIERMLRSVGVARTVRTILRVEV